MAAIGWIKLHRKIVENPIFAKEGLLQLFLYCLLSAGHKESRFLWNGAEIVLEVGCFITGRQKIAKELNMRERTVYDRLKVLQSLEMITLKSNNKFTIVKVLNYSRYQGADEETQQPVNNQPTTKQQPANTNKKLKNLENEKNNIMAAYTDNEKLQTAVWNFLDMRNELRAPMTVNALELMLKKLTKLGSTDNERIAILEQSIMNSWKGIFEIKQDPQQPKKHRNIER